MKSHRIAAALLMLASVVVAPAAAQDSRKWSPPRTPWGEPDLQGTYSNRTITPFERPANVNGREFFTKEEVAALEKGAVDLPSLSSKLFFDLLWRNTEEGYFADPIYGGNRGKVGWKLIGFPGVPSSKYKDHLDNPEPYRAEPVSILDIQMQQAQVDAQGFAKHIMLKQEGRK